MLQLSIKQLKQPNQNKITHLVYGFHQTKFGHCLIALTDKSICYLSFVDCSKDAAISELQKEWPKASLTEDTFETQKLASQIFDNKASSANNEINLLVKGTDFQFEVWNALTKIPSGKLITYTDLANLLKRPKSVRAVANAVGSNNIAYLIPCHRIIRKSGAMGDYRWGIEVKKSLISHETKVA